MTLRRMFRYISPYRTWATIAVIAMLTVALSNGALVALTRPLFDEVLTDASEGVDPAPDELSLVERIVLKRDLPEGERGALINALDAVVGPLGDWWDGLGESRWRWILVGLAVVTVVRSSSMFFSEYSFKRVGLSAVRDIRNELYEAIIHQSSNFFTQKSTGELVSRIVSDVEAIQLAVSDRLGDVFQESANLIILTAYVLYINTELSLLAFFVAPVIVIPIVQFARRLKGATRKTQERMADVSTLLEETIRGVRIVRAFGMERFEISRFHESTDRHLWINLKARKIQAMSSPVMELLAGVVILMLVSYAAFRIRAGAMTVGEFVSFALALSMMYQPVKKLNKANLAIASALAAAERVFEIVDSANEVAEKPDGVTLTGIGSGIRYENVSFSYDGARPVLQDFTLDIKPGEMVALVGSSGAGKSTIVSLLPRFYDVDEGRITIDGVDIRDATLVSLRGLIGMVTQEVILFNDSVRRNIAYGREEVTVEAIEKAAESANARSFIEELPEGLETWIGESGTRLSGGQRQRLAIARAILKDSPILILDEATSALDTESERLVQEALENLTRGRTTLVIAHRLSTVRRANRIIVLDQGKIVEEGTHDHLLAMGGVYERLHRLQFSSDDPSVVEGNVD